MSAHADFKARSGILGVWREENLGVSGGGKETRGRWPYLWSPRTSRQNTSFGVRLYRLIKGLFLNLLAQRYTRLSLVSTLTCVHLV